MAAVDITKLTGINAQDFKEISQGCHMAELLRAAETQGPKSDAPPYASKSETSAIAERGVEIGICCSIIDEPTDLI